MHQQAKVQMQNKVPSKFKIVYYIWLTPWTPETEFIDPDWGDKVNSGIGLSYRPARLHWLADRYDNPMPELTLSPSHGSVNSATVQRPLCLGLRTC